ncbi:hypothetical protein [Aeoliella sp. SH292]|uniref:hypothetical protein n=1 Tax=Aeoliella sp. SH292 TaxID=3454464 RepID=UPI003F98CDD3
MQFNTVSSRRPCKRRSGMALLLCLFVVFMVSSLVLSVVNTTVVQYAAARNVQDYERALYLANAGIHHACAELEANQSWRGVVSDGSYPNDNSYSATAADGDGGVIELVSEGVAGDVRRTVHAHVEL